MSFQFVLTNQVFHRVIAISAKTRFKNEANMHSTFFFYLWLMKRYRISARHFRQNRHFPKGPFAISFEFLFIVWRFWRLIAISAIFAKYATFAEIATFQRAPLPSHLNFCLQFGDFGDKAPFLPFSPKSPLSKGPICHLI